MKETFIPSKSFIRKKWYIIDAENKTLGRLATKIASILRGKNKSYYTPFLDTGDNIIIINSSKIIVSGNKSISKFYKKHSGRPGGMTIESYEKLQTRLPNRIIELAVKNMLPKGSLGRKIFNNFYVYSTNFHPHECQKPEKINL
jgi:large subunit ribosomal protein L13